VLPIKSITEFNRAN